jgi:hypothetical protein
MTATTHEKLDLREAELLHRMRLVGKFGTREGYKSERAIVASLWDRIDRDRQALIRATENNR